MSQLKIFAGTYEEAEVLVNKLQYEPYAYSTDNQERAKKKAKEDEEFIKTNRQEKTANDLLNAASFNLSASFLKSSGNLLHTLLIYSMLTSIFLLIIRSKISRGQMWKRLI